MWMCVCGVDVGLQSLRTSSPRVPPVPSFSDRRTDGTDVCGACRECGPRSTWELAAAQAASSTPEPTEPDAFERDPQGILAGGAHTEVSPSRRPRKRLPPAWARSPEACLLSCSPPPIRFWRLRTSPPSKRSETPSLLLPARPPQDSGLPPLPAPARPPVRVPPQAFQGPGLRRTHWLER